MKLWDFIILSFVAIIVLMLIFATFKTYTQKDINKLNTLILTDMEVRHLKKMFECVEECRCNTGHLEYKMFNNIRIKVDLLGVEDD